MKNSSPVASRAWLKAIQFMALNSAVNISPLVRREQATFINGLHSYVYRHRLIRHAIPIVLVHGMSPLGADDPRMDRCARALAANGYAIYVPQFETLRQLRITPSTADELAGYILAMTQNHEICSLGQVSVFAASFSASLALNVAARPSVRDRISAMLCIGAFGCIDTLIPHLLTDPSADPYGAAIVMANFANAVMADGESIGRLYNYKARHLFRPQDRKALEDFERAVRSETLQIRSAFWKVEKHMAYRQEIAHRIITAVPSICSALNVCEQVPHIEAPLFLMHGSTDNVVPSSELDHITLALERSGRSFMALRSPLLGHGGAEMRPSAYDVMQLARLLAGYFGAVTPRSGMANYGLTLSEQN